MIAGLDHAYVGRETAISIVINSVLSALFLWLLFGGAATVPVRGVGNLAFDFLPHLGIFAQADPIGQQSGPNLYAYADGDPVNMVDPTGLDDIVVTGIPIMPLKENPSKT